MHASTCHLEDTGTYLSTKYATKGMHVTATCESRKVTNPFSAACSKKKKKNARCSDGETQIAGHAKRQQISDKD